MWIQRSITLPAKARGFHLITDQILAGLPEIGKLSAGLLHIFLQHTSASLTINENADPDVRVDLEAALSHVVPENFPYVHTIEGPDDMPAHVKSALLGASLTLPITDGHLALGTWQGIYLCEHRNQATRRKLVLTLHGP